MSGVNIIERFVDIFRVRFREKVLNPICGRHRYNKLNFKPFTILSNNCWGGHVYRYFNAPYDSPTVGMYFFAKEYVRFLSDIKGYLSKELVFISREQSKYREELEKRDMNSPIGVLGDVEIVFLHYKTEDEARTKWQRRTSRIHWDNLYVKFSEQNLCTQKELEEFDKLDIKHKFVFTSNDYGLKSQILFREIVGAEEVKNDTLHFRKYIDLIKWINRDPDYRR